MQVKSIAECSPWSILHYFGPPLSYHFPLRPWFCLFLSGRLRQILLYLELKELNRLFFKTRVKTLIVEFGIPFKVNQW